MEKIKPLALIGAALLLLFNGCKDDKIVFNNTPVYEGGTMTLQGIYGTEAGENAMNTVFVDLSKNVQTTARRRGWDLGFYNGSDYRVILNSSVGATAVALNKTDLSQVGAADTIALATNGTLSLGANAGSISTVDPVSGTFAAYLSGTVIQAVAATAADNKVYIVNRGIGGGVDTLGWTKVRITRATDGYHAEYAAITEPSAFRKLDIVKNTSYNFNFITFSSTTATVEPPTSLWDISWGMATYQTGTALPAVQPDFVQINAAGGVTAAQIIFSGTAANSTIAYADFKEADLEGITFSADRDVIGMNWRNASAAAGVVAVYRDRYYLIKDALGNVYKLMFSNFSASDGGSRGKPVIIFEVVRRAAFVNN